MQFGTLKLNQTLWCECLWKSLCFAYFSKRL